MQFQNMPPTEQLTSNINKRYQSLTRHEESLQEALDTLVQCLKSQGMRAELGNTYASVDRVFERLTQIKSTFSPYRSPSSTPTMISSPTHQLDPQELQQKLLETSIEQDREKEIREVNRRAEL